MIQLKGKDKILFSIDKSVNEYEEFYNECKKHNSWNETELYFKLGTAILWIGVWINKIYEIEKNEKTQILNGKERELEEAFLGAYNEQKHSIKIYDISITEVALLPGEDLFPSENLFPRDFSCKWRKLNKGDINNIEPYNKTLYGKDVLTTIIEMKKIIEDKSKIL